MSDSETGRRPAAERPLEDSSSTDACTEATGAEAAGGRTSSTAKRDVPSDQGAEVRTRRSFAVQAVTAILSVLLVIIPLIPCLGFFLTPLLRRKGAEAGSGRRDAEGFVRLDIDPTALPEDGSPVMVTVFDDEIDAWNKFPDQPVGTVWLRKTEDGRVLALSTICPHLGCMVDFRPGRRDFFCPCHTSAFDLNGQRLNQIPPRNMDELEVKVADGVLWVRYRTFRAGTPEKIPV
ncbi:MAG: hypothetical protein D6725_14555 [Planctomycetota bacterium]|nr:MAG: hypothetical protein D6725_14555 [Planctomycetota bacterium]